MPLQRNPVITTYTGHDIPLCYGRRWSDRETKKERGNLAYMYGGVHSVLAVDRGAAAREEGGSKEWDKHG